jgi:predicted transcriptional regulator
LRFLIASRRTLSSFDCYDHVMSQKVGARVISLKVAELLRDERLRRGLSTRRVASLAGLSQPMIGYVERGMRNPTLDTLLRIAGALDVDLPKLIKQASSSAAVKQSGN